MERQLEQLQQKLAQLEQEMRLLNRQQELERDKAKKVPKTPTFLQADMREFSGFPSPDNNFTLCIGSQRKVDGEFDRNDKAKEYNKLFSLNNVCPILSGTFCKPFATLLSSEFGGSSPPGVGEYITMESLAHIEASIRPAAV